MVGVVYANFNYFYLTVNHEEALFPQERDRKDDFLLRTWVQISKDFEIPTANKQTVFKAAAKIIRELALLRAFLGEDLPVLRFHLRCSARPNKRHAPESPGEVSWEKRCRVQDFIL